MSVEIDITGLPPEHILFRPTPLAELCAALHALAEPDHHPGLKTWVASTLAALPGELAGRLHEARLMWGSTFSDVFVPFAGVPARRGLPGATLAEDLDVLDQLDDERFVASALEFTCAAPHDRRAPSPLTDAAERARVLELAAARGPGQQDFTRRLLTDPPALRAWVRRLLEDCDEAFFADVWQRVHGELAADARHKTELLHRKGLPAAIAEVSPALSLTGDGRHLVVDKMAVGATSALDPATGPGITFVPSRLGWPHLLVLHAEGWRPVVTYPVAAADLPQATSVQEVQERLEAIVHPARIRLARFLARAPHTTGELATATGLTAPEVSRHLAVLRKAGLVTTRRRARYAEHQLVVRPVARLGSDFLESLLR